MSIQIVDNFKLNLAVPIDTRMVTKGQSSRNSIKYAYEGLRVYDIVEKTSYVWLDGTWQKESSVTSVSASSVSAGGGGSTPPPTVVTTNRIVKYTTSTTIGEGSLFDKGTFINPSVGIGTIPANLIALDIKGMVNATTFIGAINGNNLDIKSLNISKIKPNTITTGEFALKTIGGQVVWNSAPSLNLNIVINNETSNTGVHYLLFSSSSNNTTGVPIYANNGGVSKLIGIKPSTSQILTSGDTTNDKSAPGYAFSGTTNDTSGLYGNTTEVGLSFKNNALLKLNATKLSIYDSSYNEVLKTGTNKVIFTNGEFNGTLGVTGKATLGSLKVNTGTNTFFDLNPVDLTILTGGSATINNLIVGATTTFTTLNITSLTVGPLSGAKLTTDSFYCGADYGAPAEFNSLSLTTLNVLDPDDLNFNHPDNYGYSARFDYLTVNGNPSMPTIKTQPSQPLIINGASVGNLALSVNQLNVSSGRKSVFNTGNSTFKSLTLQGDGSSRDLNGTLYCSKLRITKTDETIRDIIAQYEMPSPYENSDVIFARNGWNGSQFPVPGYEIGSIIFIQYMQTKQLGVYSETLGKTVDIPQQFVGWHFFYTGPYRGWLHLTGNAGYGIGGNDPLQKIDPNSDPYAGTANQTAYQEINSGNVGINPGGYTIDPKDPPDYGATVWDPTGQSGGDITIDPSVYDRNRDDTEGGTTPYEFG